MKGFLAKYFQAYVIQVDLNKPTMERTSYFEKYEHKKFKKNVILLIV